MKRRRFYAFTLVELLVVIAIIGTLIGLLLPAVQRARESSRRSTCLSNIRQLAMASSQYEGRFRRYPALFDELPIQKRASSGAERWTTWAVILFPDIDRATLLDDYSAGGRPLPSPYIETYLCPSDSSQLREGAVMSYAANGGGVGGPVAGTAITQKPANGPFLNRIYEPKAAVVDGHWKDGRDRTLAFSERTDSLNYDIVGWNGLNSNPNDSEVDHIDRTVVDERREDRVWGPVFVWQYSPLKCAYINAEPCQCVPDDTPPCHPVQNTGRYIANQCTIECNTAKRSPNSKPSSEHGGGVNVAFASGRAMFLRENVNYDVYRALMTLNDRQSDSPNPAQTWDDSDLD